MDTHFLKSHHEKLAYISSILSILSFSITIFNWKYPFSLHWLIIARDILIFGTMVCIIVFLIFKNISYKGVVKRKDNIISSQKEQYGQAHKIVHKFRNKCYRYFDLKDKPVNLDETTKQVFRKIAREITSQLLKEFKTYFDTRFIEEKVSFSIKLLFLGEDLPEELRQKHKVQDEEKYLVTAFRDIETHDEEEREVGANIYSVKENTVFQHIIENGNNYFCCNDLNSLGENYLNKNPDRIKHYNATLAVPIKFMEEIHGILTVDSKNLCQEYLFNSQETKDILGHAADLLAVYFLLLKQKEINN